MFYHDEQYTIQNYTKRGSWAAQLSFQLEVIWNQLQETASQWWQIFKAWSTGWNKSKIKKLFNFLQSWMPSKVLVRRMQESSKKKWNAHTSLWNDHTSDFHHWKMIIVLMNIFQKKLEDLIKFRKNYRVSCTNVLICQCRPVSIV